MFVYKFEGKEHKFQLTLIKLEYLNQRFKEHGYKDISDGIYKAIESEDTIEMLNIVRAIVIDSYEGDYCMNRRMIESLIEDIAYQPDFAKIFVESILFDLELNKKIRGTMNMNTPKAQSSIFHQNIFVTDVITHNNKVVIVKFSDGSFTKSVCSDNDRFDLDVGITVCVLKKIIGGTKNYNDLMRSIYKTIQNNAEMKKAAAEEKKALANKQKEKHDKKIRKQNEQLEIGKEIISDSVLSALEKYENSKKNASKKAPKKTGDGKK